MPEVQQDTQAQTEMPPLSAAEPTGPTAKELAAAEEANQVRMRQLAEQQVAPPPEPPVHIAEVAARGYDALQEQFRRHNENVAKKKEYVPPPRTPNQMSRLQEELEAGAKAVERARAQQMASRPEPVDGNKEGFTTPVYRPNDVVPDPISGGVKGFSPDV